MFLRTIRFKPFSPLHAASVQEWDSYIRAAVERASRFHDPAEGPFAVYRETATADPTSVIASPGAIAALARAGAGDFTLGLDVEESALHGASFEKLR
jgi:hypothetical protein